MTQRDTLIITLIVALITAGATVAGTYLGSATSSSTVREQLRHDDARHAYDLRLQAYIQMRQAADDYAGDIDIILRDRDPRADPAGVARDLKGIVARLDRDGKSAADAADEIDIIGDPLVSAAADSFMSVMNDAEVRTPSRKLRTIRANADRLLGAFDVVARADLADAR